MVTGEQAYRIALAALKTDLVPVMVPGTFRGQPAVHVHGFPVNHFPSAQLGTDVERVRTLIAMMFVARRFARTAGMET
jgi:hypothetical protein